MIQSFLLKLAIKDYYEWFLHFMLKCSLGYVIYLRYKFFPEKEKCLNFSKNLRSFPKFSNFLFKSVRDVQFMPKCNIYRVVFSVKKLKVKVELSILHS